MKAPPILELTCQFAVASLFLAPPSAFSLFFTLLDKYKDIPDDGHTGFIPLASLSGHVRDPSPSHSGGRERRSLPRFPFDLALLAKSSFRPKRPFFPLYGDNFPFTLLSLVSIPQTFFTIWSSATHVIPFFSLLPCRRLRGHIRA